MESELWSKLKIKKADLEFVADTYLCNSFRSDWMWIGDKGDVDTWINQRGWVKGEGIV